jgi:hypothetical protein
MIGHAQIALEPHHLQRLSLHVRAALVALCRTTVVMLIVTCLVTRGAAACVRRLLSGNQLFAVGNSPDSGQWRRHVAFRRANCEQAHSAARRTMLQ